MEHHAPRRPLLERHLQRRLHQFHRLPRAHCPAHHLAAEHVQHRRQVQEALLGRHVSDVRYPHLVRLCRLEAALYPVRCHGRFPVPAGRATPSPTRHALPAQRPHQPRHPLPRHRHARGPQLRVHPPRPVDLPRLGVDRRDPPARRPPPPRVVAAGGDAQHAAHTRDRIPGLVRSHKFERSYAIESVSRANQAAAFDRISRSIRSRRVSLRRRTSSSLSGLLRPS